MTGTAEKQRPAASRVKRAVITLVVLATLDWVYPVVWISLPMPGQVIDSVTRQPVGGAIVVATWRLKALDNPTGAIETQEVTTDGNGRFVVPGWGPYFHFSLGYVSENQPAVWIYTPKYSPMVLGNPCCGVQTPHFLASMRLPLIELKPAPSDIQEQRKQLAEWVFNLGWTLHQSPCEWYRIPKTNDALKQAGRSFEAVGMGSVDIFVTPPKCKGMFDP